jgi:hypothetical protein
VHEFTATACLAWTEIAKASSNRLTFEPVVSQPQRKVSNTSAISASANIGLKKGTSTVGREATVKLIFVLGNKI